LIYFNGPGGSPDELAPNDAAVIGWKLTTLAHRATDAPFEGAVRG
jgi:hypothetical protein